jgi:hypothetical protein
MTELYRSFSQGSMGCSGSTFMGGNGTYGEVRTLKKAEARSTQDDGMFFNSERGSRCDIVLDDDADSTRDDGSISV